MYELERHNERVLLIGIARSNRGRWRKIDELQELAALASTAGGTVVEKVIQIRPELNPATLLGRGKVEELGELCKQHKIDLLIFDETLTASQVRNLEEATGVRVIDRTTLILDIFARHARTAEAKTQVELAQLEYRSSILTGHGLEMSQPGGGTRGGIGPGETKLEIDRRRIRERIARLKQDLVRIEKERAVQRQARIGELRIAIAGYTNAGKSTLMNRLTAAGVKVAPEMFATLDSNTKAMALNRHLHAYLTDTVGFIRNLPHQLVTGFRSTLSEVREADLILHVVDAASADAELMIQAVQDTLKEIGSEDKPAIMVFNKTDRVFEPARLERLQRQWPGSVAVSALTGKGIDGLKQAILGWLESRLKVRSFTIPVNRGDLMSRLFKAGEILRTDVVGEKLKIRVKGYPASLARVRVEIKSALRAPLAGDRVT
jgi:GTP-binding protein HflX